VIFLSVRAFSLIGKGVFLFASSVLGAFIYIDGAMEGVPDRCLAWGLEGFGLGRL
jgi:hypothetical protein